MSNYSIQSWLKSQPRRVCVIAVLGALCGPAGAFAAPAGAPVYPDVIGEIRHYVTTNDDTLLDVARRFGLGFTEIVAATPPGSIPGCPARACD